MKKAVVYAAWGFLAIIVLAILTGKLAFFCKTEGFQNVDLVCALMWKW